MKLISLSDFLTEKIETGCAVEQIGKLRKYKDFLKQPLKLEMFICSSSESKDKILFKGDWRYSIDDRYTYLCWLTDKSETYKTITFNEVKTIEDLCGSGLELKESV
jgi:hypothetical protein